MFSKIKQSSSQINTYFKLAYKFDTIE